MPVYQHDNRNTCFGPFSILFACALCSSPIPCSGFAISYCYGEPWSENNLSGLGGGFTEMVEMENI